MITIIERILAEPITVYIYEHVISITTLTLQPQLNRMSIDNGFVIFTNDYDREVVRVIHRNDVLGKLHVFTQIHEQHLEALEQPILAVESQLLRYIRKGDINSVIEELTIPRTVGSFHGALYLTAEQLIEKYQVNKKRYPRVLFSLPNRKIK